MNLDLDVGPLLQTQKLVDSVVFAQTMGYHKVLTAAELEMMNLTGDGNGIDIVMMPLEWRDKVSTSDFFRKGDMRAIRLPFATMSFQNCLKRSMQRWMKRFNWKARRT
jgi:hypothetical protein